MKTHPSFELFGLFFFFFNHSTFDRFGADVVLVKLARFARPTYAVTLCYAPKPSTWLPKWRSFYNCSGTELFAVTVTLKA